MSLQPLRPPFADYRVVTERRGGVRTHVSADDIPEQAEIHLGVAAPSTFALSANRYLLLLLLRVLAAASIAPPPPPDHDPSLRHRGRAVPTCPVLAVSQSAAVVFMATEALSTTALCAADAGATFPSQQGSLGGWWWWCTVVHGAAKSVLAVALLLLLLLLLLLFPVTPGAALIRAGDAPSWRRQPVSRSLALGSA